MTGVTTLYLESTTGGDELRQKKTKNKTKKKKKREKLFICYQKTIFFLFPLLSVRDQRRMASSASGCIALLIILTLVAMVFSLKLMFFKLASCCMALVFVFSLWFEVTPWFSSW